MGKIKDFFTKKETYRSAIGKYQETKFKHWYYDSWLYSIECFFQRVKDFSFKYDVLYKHVYLKLQKTVAVEYDAWSLDYNLVDYLLPRIIYLINNKHGVSYEFINECIEQGLITNDFQTDEEFDIVYEYQKEKLFEIAKNLACYHLIDKYNYEKEDLEILNNRVKEGFEMIKKYIHTLWD